MGLFGKSGKTDSKPVALLDIGSGSVGGALFTRGSGKPVIHYTTRVPIERHGDELITLAMLRALEEAGKDLIERGAPALRRAAGRGHVGDVLISVAPPWQETSVRTERVEEKQPFAFTRTLMDEIVAKTAEIDKDRVSSGESVIATILNGYETSRPFGKRVNMADIIVLSSTLPATVATSVEEIARQTFHTAHHRFAAFAAIAYAVFRDIFPHEKDYLIFDIAGEVTDIAFVKSGHLTAVLAAPVGVHHLTEAGVTSLSPDIEAKTGGVHIKRVKGSPSGSNRDEWLANVMDVLRSFSETHALPRKLFMLADDDVRDYLKGVLDDATLRTLWLSDEPLTIIPITAAQLTPFTAFGPDAPADVFLSMLALFYGKSIDEIAT
jgi:hypothetical protein